MDEKISMGGDKIYISGVNVPHPVSERLSEILRTWNWNGNVCEECGVTLFNDSDTVKLAHLVGGHRYNMNGYTRCQ